MIFGYEILGVCERDECLDLAIVDCEHKGGVFCVHCCCPICWSDIAGDDCIGEIWEVDEKYDNRRY